MLPIPKRLTNFALVFHNAIEKGLLLFVATFLAVAIANSDHFIEYEAFFQTKFYLAFGNQSFGLSIRDWINDLLMAVFFFSVGMEIKREMIIGHLSRADQRLLPLFGAAGGVIIPVLIFICFNYNNTHYIKAWAVPAATDIAFALGVLGLLGKGLPISLRVFLTALAIIDDIIAVIIIAIFYTSSLHFQFLGFGISCLAILWLLSRYQISGPYLYMVIGGVMWSCFLASGVHATIAGVLLGLSVPLALEDGRKPIEVFEKAIHPLVAYFIIPIFAFANSGLSFAGFDPTILLNPVVLGIGLGLFVGKQLGVFGAVWLLIKTKIVALPEKTNLLQFYGISVICGIGFTMSLFIGILSFTNEVSTMMLIKFGVMGGSLLSCLFGALILKLSKNNE